MKPTTIRLLSDAICENPGITPDGLAHLLDFPLSRVLDTLRQLARNSIRFAATELLGPVTNLAPVSPDAETQLQMIRNATGLDVDQFISPR